MSNEKENLKNNAMDEKKKVNNKIEWLKSFVFAAIIAFLLMKFIVFFGYVPTGSMIPTINEGDRIVVWKCFRYLDWENRGLTYGDIVVFTSNNERVGEGKLLVKRVIGMGGDKISIDNGIVYRNGEKLDEPYLNEQVTNKDKYNDVVVPAGTVFMMGDNRLSSKDSRSFGCVPIEKVNGHVLIRVWPLNKIGNL